MDDKLKATLEGLSAPVDLTILFAITELLHALGQGLGEQNLTITDDEDGTLTSILIEEIYCAVELVKIAVEKEAAKHLIPEEDSLTLPDNVFVFRNEVIEA